MITLKKWLKGLLSVNKKVSIGQHATRVIEHQLSKSVDQNITNIQDALGNSFDIRSRKLTLANGCPVGLVYSEALAKEETLQEHVIKALQRTYSPEDGRQAITISDLAAFFLSTESVQQAKSLEEAIENILMGNTFLCMQGSAAGLVINTMGYETRSIDEPTIEPSVKGPKEGFVEGIKENVGLIRKRLRDPNLIITRYVIGQRSKSNILVLHIKDIAAQDLVDEVNSRLEAIKTDITIEANQIGHLMNDNPNCIFPLIQTTERPDKVVSALTEGRVAILLEGSPSALLVPVTFSMLLQSVDDYYENWFVSSVIRLTRYIALFISIFLPAVYIAVTGFHPGILPTELAFSIAATRGGIPFPAFLEAVLMEFTLELLQEAGVRLPRVIGQTVSIVGGLVIGQAAVQAGLVSPLMVIVIAVTAIASFSIPDYSLSIATRILRIPFMLLGAVLGMFGISMGALYLLGYIASQKSFGLGYLLGLTPFRARNLQDSLIRSPQWALKKRPPLLAHKDIRRQK